MTKLLISLDQLRAFHDEFDRQMDMHDIVCSSGCSYCCYQFVPVMHFEVNYIKDAIKNLDHSTKKIIQQQYKHALQHFMEKTPDRELTREDVYQTYAQQMGKDWISCPLLVNKQCAIYDLRPFTCRLHFQLDNPDLCKLNNTRDTDEHGLQLMSRFLHFLVTSGDLNLVAILQIVHDVFDKKGKIKKIPLDKYPQLK